MAIAVAAVAEALHVKRQHQRAGVESSKCPNVVEAAVDCNGWFGVLNADERLRVAGLTVRYFTFRRAVVRLVAMAAAGASSDSAAASSTSSSAADVEDSGFMARDRKGVFASALMLKCHGMDTYVVLRMERDWRLLRVDGRRGCNPEAQIWEHVVDIELRARERG
jgi:hypothetical protein